MGTSIFLYTLAWNKFSEWRRKLEEAIDSVPMPDIKKGCNNLCYNLFLWTSLGLNQGPPDYENDKMIFCDSLLSQFLLKFNQLRISLFPMELTKSP